MDTPKDCDDDALIDEARQGSELAFRRLVECNQDKLFAAMIRLLGCREDAEEAVQEAFTRAFLRIEDFNRQSKFSTWLYRIAFNTAISEARKKRPKVSLDQQFADTGSETIDEDARPVDALMLRDEQIRVVHQALDALSEEHRAILVLRELDDLAYREISDILGISVGTVRSRLNRARGRLREVIEAIQANVSERGTIHEN
ncbi:MAG: sigma-70 family RNA polymerase sigma factor [Phycisphaera sp. RhM]|nr:sigma-70 family RNA polymerase sigma factor [Phycisphaera sp. RhM]